ncbi:MAG TPA: FAD-dependent oxidoreductase [Baekduia sp.]|uniref:phytoene desaturase family protein n=1 Tax=Baekduia sp. TaxID=2600305 RepID=UPI002D76C5C6|nr:FAD-dependent oxidoreductase [Baekduia sp.]HET6506991.1 FAD-dependent oxidoreductase [Baekduia sp.]
MEHDVIVVGAGTAGLVAGALLAKEGKKVAIVEKHPYLGGRAMEHRFRGHQIGLSSHLVEDPGDSLTRACELIGVELTHSPRSDSMPFWDQDHWLPIQEFYGDASKTGIKRCIEALKETSFEEIDTLDHLSLREWMARHTSDEGVYQVWEAISVLEQITLEPWEHSASENLFIRKLHYERKRTAGYSFWPMGGWESLWDRMARAFEALGGTIVQPATVERVLVREGKVAGVELRNGEDPDAPGEVLHADEVIVNAPVWDLLRLFDDGVLPWDIQERIRLLADNRNKACWFGYWIAAEEPVIASSTLEMASFFSTPRTGLPGYTLCFTGYDASVSPPGEYLTCVGAAFDATKHYGDRAYYDKMFADLWLDIEDMMPAAKGALWKKPHLVSTYGVICKPGQVGAARPDALVRGIDGLYLTGDTTRARGIGIDKAARSGITTAETVLGRRLEFFSDTVRY